MNLLHSRLFKWGVTLAASVIALVAAPPHRAYVAEVRTPSLTGYSVFNTDTYGLDRFVHLDGKPTSIAVSPDNTRLYVTDYQNALLLVIDADTDAVLNRIPVGLHPKKVVVSHDGKRAIVACPGSGATWMVDLVNQTVVGIVAGGGPLAWSADGKRFYVGGTITISTYDTATLAWQAAVTLTRRPISIAASPDGKRIFAIGFPNAYPASSGVLVIDTATYTTSEKTIQGCLQPWDIYLSPGGTRGYLLCGGQPYAGPAAEVAYNLGNTIFDTNTFTPVRYGPGGVLDNLRVSPDGRFVYLWDDEGIEIGAYNSSNFSLAGGFFFFAPGGKADMGFSAPFYSLLDQEAQLTGMQGKRVESGACAPGQTFVVTATWKNASSSHTWMDVRGEVVALGGGNQLLSQSFAPSGGIGPGATTTGTFQVKLGACAGFAFQVVLTGYY